MAQRWCALFLLSLLLFALHPHSARASDLPPSNDLVSDSPSPLPSDSLPPASSPSGIASPPSSPPSNDPVSDSPSPPPQQQSPSPSPSNEPVSDSSSPATPPSVPEPESSNTPPSPSPSPVAGEADEVANTKVQSQDEKGSSSGGMNGGRKAGVVVGVMVGVAAVGCAGWIYKKRQDNIRRTQYGYNARTTMI